MGLGRIERESVEQKALESTLIHKCRQKEQQVEVSQLEKWHWLLPGALGVAAHATL